MSIGPESSLLCPIPDSLLCSPQDGHIPQYIRYMRGLDNGVWMLCCSRLRGGKVMVNGKTVQKVLSRDEVKALKVSIGSQCGVQTAYPCTSI